MQTVKKIKHHQKRIFRRIDYRKTKLTKLESEKKVLEPAQKALEKLEVKKKTVKSEIEELAHAFYESVRKALIDDLHCELTRAESVVYLFLALSAVDGKDGYTAKDLVKTVTNGIRVWRWKKAFGGTQKHRCGYTILGVWRPPTDLSETSLRGALTSLKRHKLVIRKEGKSSGKRGVIPGIWHAVLPSTVQLPTIH